MAILDAYERKIIHTFFKIEVVSRTRGIEPSFLAVAEIPTMFDVFYKVKSLFDEGFNFTREYKLGDYSVNLQDVIFLDSDKEEVTVKSKINIDNCKFVCLMINAVDQNDAVTVIKSNETNQRTETAPKRENKEGYESSCHILISLEKGVAGKYFSLVDQVPKMGVSLICSYINSVFYHVSVNFSSDFEIGKEFGALNSLGKKIKIRYRPFLSITGKPNLTFLENLSSDNVSNIKLIKYNKKSVNVDAHTIIEEEEHVVSIKPSLYIPDMRPWLKKVSTFYKNDLSFDCIKFSFKAEDGNSQTADLSLIASESDDFDFEKLLTKKTIISGFNPTLKDSYDSINKDIMLKLAEAHEKELI
ncbi:hypothetical protein [Photobacterium leiognathi]|uniref:hypothetical protein n=1 Tax=Photobacterium leiognathi TaxID=553611 RepID=UPI0011B248E1|nr:hypothetical protein [Photobacterium leiognathi]